MNFLRRCFPDLCSTTEISQILYWPLFLLQVPLVLVRKQRDASIFNVNNQCGTYISMIECSCECMFGELINTLAEYLFA